MDSPRILIVDDEETIRHVLVGALENNQCEIETADSAEAALALLTDSEFAVAMLDIVLPGMSGLELLPKIKQQSPDTEVLMMTSHASLETAVRAIREGAYDYLQKPFDDIDTVWPSIERALEKRSLVQRNRKLLEEKELRNRELAAAVMRQSSLIDAGRAMAEMESIAELLDFFIGLVAKELDVERASLMLLDDVTGELKIVASRGITEINVASVRVPIGRGVAGRVAASGEPFLVTNLETDPRVSRGASRDLSDSFISAPIVLSYPITAHRETLGVINVTNRRSGQSFETSDVAYLSGLSGQMAVAIQRATHLEELQTAYEDLKETQNQLVFSERLKAIGQLAAGVAHDFSNILSVVLGRAQLLLGRLDAGASDLTKICEDLRMIEQTALQGTTAIRRVREYTRLGEDTEHKPVDLNVAVKDAVEMNRPKWSTECHAQGRSVEIEMDLGHLPPVAGNVHELTQFVGNLLFNAVEALPDGGTISFRTRQEGDQVVLQVSDTGVGMSDATRERLFEPFFTTKDDGQGLGTSIVYGIVARHGGEISVASQEGAGTTFRVQLPVYEAPIEVSPEPVFEDPLQPLRVLLVEDDQTVRETYREALVGSGHEVADFGSGKQALSSYAENNYDLIVTDLSMPGMTGLELSAAVKRRDPMVPVVLLSGWALQQEEEKFRQAGIDFVLTKPCTIHVLLETVAKAISDGTKARDVPETPDALTRDATP
jgi:signal transduction histidine kinase/BarA-like signal transduction histidine kinase